MSHARAPGLKASTGSARAADRRDLAGLGLYLLFVGLVVAPIVHATVGHLPPEAELRSAPAPHDESQPHHHGASHRHQDGSLEHLGALAVESDASPSFDAIAAIYEEPIVPADHVGARGGEFSPVQAQGP